MTSGNTSKLDPAVLKIAGVIVIGSIMSILDTTVVNVALQTFTETFHTTQAAWTMTGYTLALAAVIPLSGWAADRFGTKRLYMLALVLFVLGSVLCSTAWNIGSLITFRVVQGLGGGMLTPIGMTILTRAAGPDRVGRLMSVLGIPMLLGPIGGPILGGWLINIASWHWIFLINLPIGVIALVYAFLALPKDQTHKNERFDFVGMLLLSPGLALLLFGVSKIGTEGTVASGEVLVPALIGLVLVVLFVFHAFRPEHPLIDLRLLRNRKLAISVISMFMFAVAFFGAMILLPYYFLQVRGETTLRAGLLLAPQGLGAMLTMPIAGRLADRIPVKRIAAPGLILIATGYSVLSQISPTTSFWLIGGALFVNGLGMGCTMMPLFASAMQTLHGPTIARGSTLMNITQQVAASCGTAILSMVLLHREKSTAAGRGILGFFQNPQTPDNPHGVPLPPDHVQGLADLAHAQGFTYVVAAAIMLLTLIPVLSLPNRKQTLDPEAEQDTAVAAVMH